MADKKIILYPKFPKGEDGHRTFSIRVESEMVERLDEISKNTGISRNELISTFLKFALENYEIYSDDERR